MFDSLNGYHLGAVMKVIAKYFPTLFPPLLQLYIHDSPHRRMHIQTIQQYRLALYEGIAKTGVKMPIQNDIELDVLFVNPSTPDLGNAYLALEQALDNKTLTKPGIVEDDSLIQKVTMAKYFNQKPKK